MDETFSFAKLASKCFMLVKQCVQHFNISNASLFRLCYFLGVPLSVPAVWKDIFRDNLNLKRNWAKGRCKVTDMAGHTHK